MAVPKAVRISSLLEIKTAPPRAVDSSTRFE
jgi:hypothetical protein